MIHMIIDRYFTKNFVLVDLCMLISSISENLFILQLQASSQYCKVFKAIES